MKNRIFILAMLLCCTFAATAQNYNLRIHKNGDVQNQWNTSTISNIGLDNGVATFTINGSDIQKSFSDIDSITFYNINGGNTDAKVFLIGNKIDLENERKVTKEQGEKFCKENNINEFMESSAKTGVNAQNIFIKAAQTLYEDYIKYQKKAEQSGGSIDNPNMNYGQMQDNRKKIDNKPKKKQGGCC